MTVPATGWYVEVDHPTTSYTHTPRVVDSQAVGPQFPPRANRVPEVRVPVPKDDMWRDLLDASSDASMRVWRDGERLPIDTLDAVETTVSGGTAYDVLVGTGGGELGQRVTQSYDQKAVHLAAQDLVDNNTTLATNVDAPSTTTQTNTTLLTLSSQSDFLSRTNRVSTDPWDASGGSLVVYQTCFTTEAETTTNVSGADIFTANRYSGNGGASGEGEALRFDAVGEWGEWQITPSYTIPADDFAWAIRHDAGGSSGSFDIAYSIDGPGMGGQTTLLERSLGTDAVGWTDLDAAGTWSAPPSDLLAGETYTLRGEATASGTDTFFIDVVAPNDGRFSYTFDNTLTDGSDGGTYLDGPELYPSDAEVPLDAVVAPQAVTGGRAEATLNGGDSSYTHYLSNDQGASFTSGTGANFESDSIGTSWGPSLTYKAGLGRWGSRDTATPRTGFNRHELQSLTLKADLEDMPLVVNTTVDGHISSILTDQFATAADAIWGVSWNGTAQQVEWTAPGQRTADETPDVAEYQAAKSVGGVYQKAVVYGQADVPRTDVRFQADHGNAVSLPDDRLQANTLTVSDPDTGERYRSGQDYTLDAQAGEITTLAGGSMTDGSTYTADYRFQAYGEHDDGTADPDVTDAQEIPGLRTDFACQQAARLIVEEVNVPQRTATATIPAAATSWSVVEALDPPIVPTDGQALHVKAVENSPQQTVLTLGNRRSVRDVVQQIRSQVSAVSRKA